MNCQKFEEVVGELAREQIMHATARDEAKLHAENCASCLNRLQEESLLAHSLKDLASEMATLNAPPALEAELLSAFSARQQVAVLPVRTTYRRYWLGAAAAGLVVAFGLISLSLSHRQASSLPVVAFDSGQSQPGGNVGVVQTSIQNNLEQKSASHKELVQKRLTTPTINRHSQLSKSSRVDRRMPNSLNQQNMVALNSNPREIATEFLPLGSMSEASLQDGGQIVRVELPRSALANFGFPVNMDRYNERVKADLVVGMDGLAHAIRFVQ